MSATDGLSDTPNRIAATRAESPGGEVPAVDIATAAGMAVYVDPCDVACEAMPAQVIGDLTPTESSWLLRHTANCRYCANELDRFEHVNVVLDRLHPLPPADLVPPTVPLPRRQRAGYARVESPVGPLFVAATDVGLCEIDFAAHESEAALRRRLMTRGFDPRPAPAGDPHSVVGQAAQQLHEYFGGRRDHFDLSLDFTGVSPFTRAVLEATAEVPFGRLNTYRGIATRVGRPGATRAVGNALGRNPIPVVVPCHRIVRSDSSIGGYTGDVAIKERLLALEGVTLGYHDMSPPPHQI